MDDINDIIANLSQEDIDSLKAAAQEFFGDTPPFFQSETKKEEKSQPKNSMPDFASLLSNAELMSKMAKIMGAMNKHDEREELIRALKPHLSRKRRQRADEAMQMLKLFDILPLLQNEFGKGDKNG